MRFVINKKVYDTEKMILIGQVQKWYKFQLTTMRIAFGENAGRYEDCKLYRSNKGNYLLTHKLYSNTYEGEAITEEEAKDLLIKWDYENYVKLFGELEEA